MNWPTTVAGILVLVLAVLPGLLAEHLYRALAGVSWREKDARQLLRLLAFSVLGLVGYVLVASAFGWYMPEYVVPATFASGFTSAQLPALSWPYLGHWTIAALVGAISAKLSHVTAGIRSQSANRDAWDHFVRCAAPGHWVVVTLQNGDSYAGQIDHADVAVEPEYRDLVLSEPYRYEFTEKNYVPTYHQYLFLRGADVASIAAIYSSDDTRVIDVYRSPFKESQNA